MFEEELLIWHDANKRNLPWCGEKDPYRIWISEIMLQQTRTETVEGYYKRFLEAFPNVFVLAEASEEQVFKQWEGLGYYSRARNLHKAAKQIVSEYDGTLPDTAEGLLKLSGIGDYTAGAVASIAFGRKELAMDGNVTRVLSRVLCEKRCVGETAVKRHLKREGTALMSEKRPGDFNQAMMGLGNMICIPARPRCEICPVKEYCAAYREGVQAELPVLPAKPEKKQIPVGVGMVLCRGKVLIVKRPDEGLLAGLWAFPVLEGADSEQAVRELLKDMGVSCAQGEKSEEAKHIFTHRVWKMKGWVYSANEMNDGEHMRWVDADGLEQAALPTALKVYRSLVSELLQGTEENAL